ncbi:MAG: DUF4296 domain-containing protein [Eudoraea sp.]|nr:DUF4296 domain-containing protein [Eudoraea sp.]
MKKLVLFLLVLVIGTSCVEKIIKKPDDLIPREKMTQLLYDLAILNAAKGTNSAILEVHFDSPTYFLFEQYGVDSLQFVHSDIYYASQPLLYEAIYKEVAAKLEKEKNEIEEARKKVNDSLAARSRKLRDSISE